jgi:hypothetical protein
MATTNEPVKMARPLWERIIRVIFHIINLSTHTNLAAMRNFVDVPEKLVLIMVRALCN